MEKMWAGRFDKQLNKLADDFNSSLHFDCRMYRDDITGSIAHATMLGAKGIISTDDVKKIIDGLTGILEDLDSGKLDFSAGGEDIHMFVEAELTKRIGDAGKRLHTARSRNDQVALDIRLYLRHEIADITDMVKELMTVLCKRAKDGIDAIMPGYTHMQRAQPITFGHHLMAYTMMLERDLGRLSDTLGRMNYSPLGSCALAGTTYPTDRKAVADKLEMNGAMKNSLDGVSDRDFCVELCSALSILMMHMSRLSEEIVLWSSWEFKFIELDDSYSTGSSIMPQKKNPDMAELIRGKTARVYGDLNTLLVMLKGLPLAYNKDMQEDKEAIFDAVDTVKMCLSVMTPMLDTMEILRDNMKNAAARGFINATDLADYLTKKGVPFRTSYKIVGQLVNRCIQTGYVLDNLPMDIYREYSDVFEDDLYNEISLETCVMKRSSFGGTSVEQVQMQIDYIEGILK